MEGAGLGWAEGLAAISLGLSKSMDVGSCSAEWHSCLRALSGTLRRSCCQLQAVGPVEPPAGLEACQLEGALLYPHASGWPPEGYERAQMHAGVLNKCIMTGALHMLPAACRPVQPHASECRCRLPHNYSSFTAG